MKLLTTSNGANPRDQGRPARHPRGQKRPCLSKTAFSIKPRPCALERDRYRPCKLAASACPGARPPYGPKVSVRSEAPAPFHLVQTSPVPSAKHGLFSDRERPCCMACIQDWCAEPGKTSTRDTAGGPRRRVWRE